MQPRIELLNPKKLVGIRKRMSFSNNKTFELWQSFMPNRGRISNILSANLYSIEVYDSLDFFLHFNPNIEFDKWAAVEVNEYIDIPSGMETLAIPEGLYAVFIHKGLASEGIKTYKFIFSTWIPNSEYELDGRPHFALMGEKYRNNDINSEEEIWIPIKRKEGTSL